MSAPRARVLPRTEFGDPILTRRAKRVTRAYLKSEAFRALVRDLVRTMRASGGVGLAAPQVGVPLQVAVMEVRETPTRRGVATRKLQVIVNPEITETFGKPVLKWEGCLSFSKTFGRVPRYPKVSVRYTDTDGNSVDETAGGLWGHIFQHEIDHLQGIRYIDRMEDARTLVTEAEYRKRFAKRRKA